MDYEQYRKAYFVDPQPQPRYQFSSRFNVTLYYQSYQQAIDYYSNVLGPPAYVEGEGTRSWPIGGGWLTLLRGKDGDPKNVELMFELETIADAEKLQQAAIAAGGQGPEPIDTYMGVPIRACPARDPFGVDLMIFAALPGK